MDLYLNFSFRFVFNKEGEKEKKRLAGRKKHEWCSNNNFLYFNIYEDIIVFLLILKICFLPRFQSTILKTLVVK